MVRMIVHGERGMNPVTMTIINPRKKTAEAQLSNLNDLVSGSPVSYSLST